MNNSFKILISYNEKHKVLKNDFLVPIQTGRSLSDEKFSEMIGDDSGENISILNPFFAELTAQYWAWKNYKDLGDPAYIGFMHYRRHFIFNENYFDSNVKKETVYGYSSFYFDKIDEDYLNSISLDKKTISNIINGNDAIFVRKSNMHFLGCKNAKEELLKNNPGLKPEYYDLCMSTLERLFPKFKDAIDILNSGPNRYFYNMFIMKKELFFDYSNILFKVLLDLFKDLDLLSSSTKYARVCGYLGELILSVYIFHLYISKTYKIKELYASFVENTFYDEDLKLKWSNHLNAIACSCSNEYVPYLSVYLQSICDFSCSSNYYDIVVLESDISAENKSKLMSVVVSRDNISLRFYNVNYLFSDSALHISYACFSKQCYYRLAIGKIFARYHKVLFTDIDLIFNFDPNDAFLLPMNSYPIAACEEILWNKQNRVGKIQKNINVEDYIKFCVKCTDKYYNTGVIIVDIPRFNSIASFDSLLKVALSNTFINQEQCVLNNVFNQKFYTLPSIYNFEIYDVIFNSDKLIMKNYMSNINNALIFHFLTNKKVWFFPELPKAHLWWDLAQKSIFYCEIISRLLNFRIRIQQSNYEAQLRKELSTIHFPNINNRFASLDYNFKLLFISNHILKFRLRKYRYAIKCLFSFGEAHVKNRHRYDVLKKQLKDVKHFCKALAKL